ncbi:MAG TPA: diaminopimelate epimerase [Mycobacteriales bacterium]
MEFARGHGTGNDFVVLPDLGGELDLSGDLVRALCDRRTGVGGDGTLRIVPTAKVPEAVGLAGEAYWFMDYRNADGSLAEMCGNGIRVYARWLQRADLIEPGPLPVATRDGIKVVHVPADPEGDLTVEMGVPVLPGTPRTVSVPSGTRSGIEVDMGNPHVVVEVDDVADAGPLLEPPVLDPPSAANVEFVQGVAPGRLRMRVFERGAGETRSCGTGACAAAVAAAVRNGDGEGSYDVEVPGGRLHVDWHGSVTLTGPAEIVATGTVDAAWLATR